MPSAVTDGSGSESPSMQRTAGRTQQFIACSLVVFSCFTVYGVLQEYILKRIPGYEYGTFMTLFQFTVSGLLMHVYRNVSAGGQKPTNAPIHAFAMIALLSVATVGLSNVSVSYLNYPTQVLLKNAKLIPVMLVGRLWLGKAYSTLHYVAVVSLTVGLIIFSVGDSLSKTEFNVMGLVLISGALLADAFIGNVQEHILSAYRVSTVELIYFTKLFGAMFICFVCLAMGELSPALQFVQSHPSTVAYLLMYSVSGMVGELSVLTLIELFGALEAVTVTSLRKMFTIILSFLLFPKPVSAMHYAGAAIVFGAIALNVYTKNAKAIDPIIARIMLRIGYKKPIAYTTLDQVQTMA